MTERTRSEFPSAPGQAQRPAAFVTSADVFEWYVKNSGPDVNLFVDHSQTVQLECLRRGLWGTKSTWGRIQTYRPEGE